MTSVKPPPTQDELKRRLVDALADHPTVTAACEIANVARRTYYTWREIDKDFARECDRSIRIGRIEMLEEKAVERGIQGSDKLLIFLLTGYMRDVFGSRVLHGNDPDNPIPPLVIIGPPGEPDKG